MDPNHLRQFIGFVPQEPSLFNDTIYNNILYGSRNANRFQVEKAAQTANIHSFIMTLSEGYDTIVGEGGIQMSGGEKQRISIARAVLRDPKILILDEATSALDKENEQLVEKALEEASKGRTTIVIAHKLSTIVGADVSVVIDNGRVVELGSHSELMKQEGMYYKLMLKQSNLLSENETNRSYPKISTKAKTTLCKITDESTKVNITFMKCHCSFIIIG